jgi:hypothetical protein
MSTAAGPPESDSRTPTTHEFSRKFRMIITARANNAAFHEDQQSETLGLSFILIMNNGEGDHHCTD